MTKIASLPKPPMTPKERLDVVTKIVDILGDIPTNEIMPLMGMVIAITGVGKHGIQLPSLVDKKSH